MGATGRYNGPSLAERTAVREASKIGFYVRMSRDVTKVGLRTAFADAGCAVLVAALDSGALPALKELEFGWFDDDLPWPRHFPTGIPASGEAIDAVRDALAISRCR